MMVKKGRKILYYLTITIHHSAWHPSLPCASRTWLGRGTRCSPRCLGSCKGSGSPKRRPKRRPRRRRKDPTPPSTDSQSKFAIALSYMLVQNITLQSCTYDCHDGKSLNRNRNCHVRVRVRQSNGNWKWKVLETAFGML